MMAEATLLLTDAPDAAAQAAIEDGLSAFNWEQAGFTNTRPLAVLIRDPSTGAVAGGLLGRTTYGLLFIDLVFLPAWARGRGLGRAVLRMAEQEARQRGCTSAVLYTITFQAPGFYAREGYRTLGRIECDPPGHSRICMTKRLVPDQPGSGL